ncbi:NPCBM/NEW2 domain-containing protein [Aeoliella mucimassa]|uniref:NPCBM/NEW2 domain protein n=1 Tax=Aeoliella mucimassa TaxID=2527972 RepID=A0A518AJY5_9BACT|nr:NPCBM/NEW2 domain-containing protein [Aeoliella mucimassa]QDU55006.1 NPCBM/NEW2 domain protein [Aeoliella mucimassa]
MSFAIRALACTIALGAMLATTAQAANQLVLTSGARTAGQVVSLNAGTLVVNSGDNTSSYGPGEWLRWQHPADCEPRPQLWLQGRTHLVAKRDWTGKVPITLNQQTATIDTASLGKITIPRKQLNCLLIEAAKEPLRSQQILAQAQQPADTDRVWLAAGDQLSGKVLSFNGVTLEFEFAGGKVPLLAKDIAAVALASTPQAPQGSRYLVGMADGSLVESTEVTLDSEQLVLTALGEWRTRKIDQLVFVQSLDESIDYLSDLQPVDFRHTPYFTGTWPLARDRALAGSPLRAGGKSYAKGLAMHSAARAVYRVPAGAKQLLADVAIDDSTHRGGSALFAVYRVNAEGVKPAYSSGVVRGGDAPRSVAVDVAGATAVVLVVDYAEDGDQQDHANWLDARFVQVAASEPPPAEPTPEPTPDATSKHEPQPLELAGLENVFQLTPRVTSGSGPATDQAFASLAEQGITTVVSVDGAKPDIDLAHKHGLRYLHIPIGYDGLSREAELALARVMQETEGRVYIHCHHGKHRGPAAAAIACLADGALDPAAAAHVLEVAGTSEKYRGLWRDVAEFAPPKPEEQLPELVETASVTGRVAAMSQIDMAFEHLTALESNEWQAPADHPDLDRAEQATLLWEGYRESQRFSEQQGEADLAKLFDPSITQAEQLRQALEQGDVAKASTLMTELKQSCATCHEGYRNNR